MPETTAKSEKTTKKYKDTVFSSLFYDCEDAVENAKDLYKALTGRTVIHAEKCRLEDVLYREFMNDVAYIMDGRFICFIEHQSTINPNMPLRCFLYAARTYERSAITDENKLIYSTRKIKIPAPEFYVLYNGTRPMNNTELKLSDSYMESTGEPGMELRVKVININIDKIEETELQQCKTLYGYSYLVDKVRRCGGDIDKAVHECITDGILPNYLKIWGSEVYNMLYTEYDAEKAKQMLIDEVREDGKAEGRAEGRAEGKAEGMFKAVIMLKNLGINIDKIISSLVEQYGMTKDEASSKVHEILAQS